MSAPLRAPLQAPDPVAALAALALSSPHDPWLFYRDGWDWRWRCFRQVGDQVARGAEALERWGGEDRRIGFDGCQDPDAIAAGLAIQAAGATAVPVAGGAAEAARLDCDGWIEVGEHGGETPGSGIDRISLPAARSVLEKWQPRRLEAVPLLDGLPAAAGLALPGLERQPAAASWLAARRLDSRLPAAVERPIVCAGSLDPRESQLLLAWTLLGAAAWVLEPLAEAFVATVLWARPTLAWATAGELERLAAGMGRGDRRHSRLRGVVVAGAMGSTADEEHQVGEALGMPVVELEEILR